MFRNYFFLLCITVLILTDVETTDGSPNFDNRTQESMNFSEVYDKNKSNFSMKTLLTGPIEELKLVSKVTMLKALWAIKKMQVPLDRKFIIWDILKGNRSSRALTRDVLELCGNLLIDISEYDLYNLNISDWNIVDFLGTFDGFSRRKTGIIAYALVNYYSNNDLLEESKKINKFKGLICGFPPSQLHAINSTIFVKLSEAVFTHIYSCTFRQRMVLLENAMRTTTYGPPQAWNASNVKKMGLVIRGLNLEMLSKLRPESMAGISEETITRMSLQQLRHLSNEQVRHLSNPSLSAYRGIVGLASSFASMACKSNTILIICCMIIKIIQFN